MEDGNLPIDGHPHPATWREFRERFCCGEHRANMTKVLSELLQRGKDCKFKKVIFIGSFVTARENPRDVDLIWLTDSKLNKDALSEGCKILLDSSEAPKRFGCDVFYCPENSEMLRVLVGYESGFGIDKISKKPRGLVIIDLENDDLS